MRCYIGSRNIDVKWSLTGVEDVEDVRENIKLRTGSLALEQNKLLRHLIWYSVATRIMGISPLPPEQDGTSQGMEHQRRLETMPNALRGLLVMLEVGYFCISHLQCSPSACFNCWGPQLESQCLATEVSYRNRIGIERLHRSGCNQCRASRLATSTSPVTLLPA